MILPHAATECQGGTLVHLITGSLFATSRSLLPLPEQSGPYRLAEESSAVRARVSPTVARYTILRLDGGSIGTARVVVIDRTTERKSRMPRERIRHSESFTDSVARCATAPADQEVRRADLWSRTKTPSCRTHDTDTHSRPQMGSREHDPRLRN
jgi:hypothetical protein